MAKSDETIRQNNYLDTTKHVLNKSFKNALKCSKGESEDFSHRLTKFIIANWCWSKKIDFYSEATFYDMKRADIIIPSFGIAIEVLNTEKIKSFDCKQYPIPTIPLSVSMKKEEVETLLEELYDTHGGAAVFYINKCLPKKCNLCGSSLNDNNRSEIYENKCFRCGARH